uniref:ArsA/GET3 Anion-transporting ATPase-like domain-containing protein n=1 Tax=Micromonas pusilla TaxID=38833 RepID=A0A7R9XZ74_MICPS
MATAAAAPLALSRALAPSSRVGDTRGSARKRLGSSVRVRVSRRAPVVTSASSSVESAGFSEMSAGRDRKYYMVGGKGGVGKTSLSSSLAVKFAMNGHPTLLVSTDPAHSLSDSLAQDVTGGVPVCVDGTDAQLYAMEVDPNQAKEEFAAFAKQTDMSQGAKDFMGSVGLGGLADQLGDLKLGELLDTPPPGLDEAIAISKVVQFIKDEKYAKFTRIVFDTAPTGHTLRLLSLPDFLDKSIGKIVRLRQKLTSATDAVKGLFGVDDGKQDEAVAKLEKLKAQLQEVKDLFRNEKTTEFVIVTIPTVLGISESGRLLSSLEKEKVPTRRLVVNQIVQVTGEGFGARKEELAAKQEALREAIVAAGAVDGLAEKLDALIAAQGAVTKDAQTAVNFCAVKAKDQRRAMEMLDEDAGLRGLRRIEAPLFDMEIRGVPALQFMAGQVWTD